MKRRRNVDLDEPGLQARVEEDVEAEELVADVVGVEVEPVDRVHGVLRADDRLDHLKSNNNAPSKLGLSHYSFVCNFFIKSSSRVSLTSRQSPGSGLLTG